MAQLYGGQYAWILNQSMLSTDCFAHFTVLSFEIVFD